LEEWKTNHKKNYVLFLKASAIGAALVNLLLYLFVDVRPSTENYANYFLFIRTIIIALSLLMFFYPDSNYYKKSEHYKAPVFLFALFFCYIQFYNIAFVDHEIPIIYLFLAPFIFVWILQLSPGSSVIILTLILTAKSVGIMVLNPNNVFYFNNIVSLFSVAIFMIFLMRMSMLNEIKLFLANKKYLEETKLRYKELGDLAAQVAHDIRSPLTAIMILSKDEPSLSEDSRILFKTGVTRILDITNDLLNKAKGFLTTNQESPTEETEKSSVQLITTIIESLVSEKRVEYRSKLNVNLQTNFNQSSFGLFANIQKSEFKRILSNLINNSVEAVRNRGKIEVTAEIT
ncbi:MAG: hypothetical protein JNM96_01240, partial [Bacteroidia bacterium]|nr:hypothetical protein [Bacteroidia bacterium]